MNRVFLFATALVVCALFWAAPAAQAEVGLPRIFGDNMILQRDAATPVWGRAKPGEKVTVAFVGQSKTAVADTDGKWSVRLEPSAAGGPFEMKISASNSVTFKNVLVGEVWIAGGQSNMQMRVHQVADGQDECARANYPQIRLSTVAHMGALAPQGDLYCEWSECNPQTVRNFSAVAYFFARKLHQDLGVPVGVVNDCWSGSLCETWVSKEGLDALPEAAPLLEAWDRAIGERGPKEKEIEAKFRAKLAAWEKEYDRAPAGAKPDSVWPDDQGDPILSFERPTGNYNGMIAPLVPYGIRGAIWYQGEGNSERAVQYRNLFKALVTDWRRAWGQGDFPFLFVQLSSYRQAPTQPGDSEWAETREAQAMALALRNTAMAVSLDCGDAGDAHFKNKKPVGERLALAAEAIAYGKNIAYKGPTYESFKVEGDKMRIEFADTQGGLEARGGELKGFEIAGEDKAFVWADARIDGDSVVVSSRQVSKPVAVRYAWSDNALAANLYNKAGLPAGTFRTDNWRLVTEGVLVWPGI